MLDVTVKVPEDSLSDVLDAVAELDIRHFHIDAPSIGKAIDSISMEANRKPAHCRLKRSSAKEVKSDEERTGFLRFCFRP